MSSSIKVSVVIPSKDRPVLIQRAVANALAQERVALEVIVVDDGSSPPVSLATSDPRVRVVRHEAAQGVAAARNRGVAEARGKWIAFLDDDDLWAPDKLFSQIEHLELTSRKWGSPGTIWLSADMKVRHLSSPPAEPITLDVVRRGNLVGSPSGVVADRELVQEAGGFDAQFSTFADWDLWLRLAAIAPGGSVDQPLLGYVTHEGSMHRQSVVTTLTELRRLQRHHRDLPTGPIHGCLTWRWMAVTQHDSGHGWAAVALALSASVRYWDRSMFALASRWAARQLIPRRTPRPETLAPAWVSTAAALPEASA